MCDDCLAHADAADEPAPCPGSPPWPGTEPAAELAELIAEQAADDADPRAPRHAREIPATDLDGRTTRRNGRHEQATGTTPRRGWRMLERQVDHRCSPRAWESEVLKAIDQAAASAVKSGGENRAGRQPELQYPILFFTGTGRTWDADEVHYTPLNGPCPACRDLRMSPSYCCAVCHSTVDSPTRWPMQDPEWATRGKRAEGKVKQAKVKAKVKRVRAKRKAAKART